MKRTLSIIIFLLLGLVSSFGQKTLSETSVLPRGYGISRNGSRLDVDLTVDASGCGVHSNRMVVLTPMLVGADDTLSLSSVGVMGRRRYFHYLRNEERYPDVASRENYRTGDRPDTLVWMEAVPYSGWMNGSRLQLLRQMYGCCGDLLEQDVLELGVYRTYEPVFSWITPYVENPKVRHLEGSAFVDFVVSTTDIRPDYRENRREIGKILASIDSLRTDSDITIDSISIKGFASPESPYSNNTRLAKGRTLALKDYVTQLYSFDEDFIRTSYEPEDWDGLRRLVSESNIDHKDSILSIIGSGMEPDAREARIRREYPKEYKFMLDLWYPALRHSDYRIVYRIRQFDDMDEILRIFRSTPAKLSLRELFNLSATYEPGSESFNEVFEVAVMVYPDNRTANLNAANVAMSSGELERAARYLAKSGDSPEAVYARGVHAGLSRDYAGAKALFLQASQEAHKAGNPELTKLAAYAYAQMDDYMTPQTLTSSAVSVPVPADSPSGKKGAVKEGSRSSKEGRLSRSERKAAEQAALAEEAARAEAERIRMEAEQKALEEKEAAYRKAKAEVEAKRAKAEAEQRAREEARRQAEQGN